ncbi:TetR/AcrR family transcriptional regulator [Curtobacterium sp. MCBD17_040]|uniref:TetR/AcrR family transcriptional regulator n=1 Tax=Curtobacterium sp. MCBD17_040 TaxID=2175674 RepID=UPI0015E8A729|nr:TetR/AcrR family transcriptional regulator [Curtobacterium sp. MCBD17_040]WIB64134.1 TetR/AcrR family transcriptional regulator [Curtobacterium sp. MCBD17_040]
MHDQASPTTTRQEQKANTRSAILRAAATEFATRGYAGTSIASIAAAMGKPKSAVGHHQFTSKQQIAEAIVRQQQEAWASMRTRVEQATPPGFVRLLRLLMTAALDARAHPSALAAVRLMADHRANGIALPPSTVPWRAYVADQIQIDMDAGRVPLTRPAEELARRLLNASFGVFDAESRGLQAIDTEAALRALWADLLAGFGIADVDAVLAQVRPEDDAPSA